jgi:hypothetical protein
VAADVPRRWISNLPCRERKCVYFVAGHCSCSVRRRLPSICFVGYDDDQPSMQSAWVCDITRGTGRSEYVKSTHEPLAVFWLHTNSNQYCPSYSSSICTVVTFCASHIPKAQQWTNIPNYIIFCGHNSQLTFLQMGKKKCKLQSVRELSHKCFRVPQFQLSNQMTNSLHHQYYASGTRFRDAISHYLHTE